MYNLQQAFLHALALTGFIVGISAQTWCVLDPLALLIPISFPPGVVRITMLANPSCLPVSTNLSVLGASNTEEMSGGQFPIPAISPTPLLALRCSPAIRPYLAEDATTLSSYDMAILIDAHVTFRQIFNAASISITDLSVPAGSLSVSVSVDGNEITNGTVPLNATKYALPFSLSSLKPRVEAYTITCNAVFSSQRYQATGSLTYLPNPPPSIGSVTKMDLRTGALLAKPADGKGGSYAAVFPIGFYTAFDGYLTQNSSISAELKAQG